MLRRGVRQLGQVLNEPNPFHIFKVNFLQIHHQNEDPRIVLARTKYANDIEKDVNALVVDAHRASLPHLTVLPVIEETGKIPEHRSIVAKDKYALARLADKDSAQQQYSVAFADCIQFYWDWSRARASEGIYPMDYNDTYDFGGPASSPADTEADLVKWLGYSLFIGLVGAVLTAQVWFIDYRGDGIMDWGMFYADGKPPPAALKKLGLLQDDEE